jgi:hypothetical protein
LASGQWIGAGFVCTVGGGTAAAIELEFAGFTGTDQGVAGGFGLGNDAGTVFGGTEATAAFAGGGGNGGGTTGFGCNAGAALEVTGGASATLTDTGTTGAVEAAPNRIPNGLAALNVKPKAQLKPTSTNNCPQTPVAKTPGGRAVVVALDAVPGPLADPGGFRCLFAALIVRRA